MIDDYRKHAVVWDWDGFDNSLEYEYWCKYARQYGKKVLIPMCALGQVGAYMAQKGFSVTAFDITKEMIDEGEKRFRSVENLSLNIADICNLHLSESDFDFCFIATQDLHLLSDLKMVRKAFQSLSLHLREGGGLSLELVLPSSESSKPFIRGYQIIQIKRYGKRVRTVTMHLQKGIISIRLYTYKMKKELRLFHIRLPCSIINRRKSVLP